MRRLGPIVLIGAVLAGCGGPSYHSTLGAHIVRFKLMSRLLGDSLGEILVTPAGGSRSRPLLVLLHGRGAHPSQFSSDAFFEELGRLGRRAPDVLLPSGGDHSYWHDRREGPWASYLLREAIPAALAQTAADSRRIAIGGISMGGFGAFDIARLHPHRFCAVGSHSGALWTSSRETASGAFDDATDFARHNVLGAARRADPYGQTPVWIDVGRDDPFRSADTALARDLRFHGARVTFWLHGGGHNGWGSRMAIYLRFYARALARCAR